MGKGLTHKAVPILLLALLTTTPCLSIAQEVDKIPVLSVTDQAGAATGGQHADCRDLMAGIEEQNRKLGQELRQVKREIAVLNQNLEKPGLREVSAGIGYIVGMFGVAAFVAARRRDRKVGGD